MNWDKVQSYVLHALVGVLLTAVPAMIDGIPDTYKTMTVGAVLLMLFKVLHDAIGY